MARASSVDGGVVNDVDYFTTDARGTGVPADFFCGIAVVINFYGNLKFDALHRAPRRCRQSRRRSVPC